ncbi:MAG: tetratricopeptide repeat protein [Desulfovibrio sp.]|jgi:tetratricopeptide (TPR) repeat protein|nr:tetratricopeptide repeat protein [Desulfovibrio sp.]
MTPQKTQGTEGPALLQELQSEVAAESTPLLTFIISHATVILSCAVIFAVVIGVAGAYNWYQANASEDARRDLARITAIKDDADRLRALKVFADDAPSSVRLSAYMTLGQMAVENGDFNVAAAAYNKAAAVDPDGALGKAALLGEASSRLQAGDGAKALELLQGLERQLPEQAKTAQFKQIMAEAAEKAARPDMASRIYADLAKIAQGADADFFREQAKRLQKTAQKPAEAAKTESPATPEGAGTQGASEKP